MAEALTMRMSPLIAVVAPALLATSVLAVELPKTLVANGQTYEGVTYQSHTPSRLSIMHESGVASIPIGSLPAELRQKLGYSEETARAAEQQAAEQQAQFNAAQAQQARAAEIKKTLEKVANTISSRIFQVVPDGVLIDSTVYVQGVITNTHEVSANNLLRPEATKLVVSRREGLVSKRLSEGDYVFVRTEQSGYIDGADYIGTVYPIGTYSYETVAGGSKTLHAFTDIPEVAVRHLVSE
jgi:hypothetical protein